MFYANAPDGTKTIATPDSEATCPSCEEPLIAKCGSIVTWHWAHRSAIDCDSWAEPDSAWHRGWQALADHDRCEVVIEKLWNDEHTKHRADIYTADGTVVELQDSSIPPEEIQERENFYGNMIWIFNAAKPYEEDRLLIYKRRGYQTFRWKHPRKSLEACTKPVLLDLGPELPLLRLKKIHTDPPCGGWTYQIPRQEIIDWITSPTATLSGTKEQTWPYNQKSADPIGSTHQPAVDRMHFTKSEATQCRCGERIQTWIFSHPRTIECTAGHITIIDPPKNHPNVWPPETTDYAELIDVGD